MTAPERIWAWPWEVNPSMGQWEVSRSIVGEGNEYVRADLYDTLAADRDAQKARADDAEAERDRVSSVAADMVGLCAQANKQVKEFSDKAHREYAARIAAETALAAEKAKVTALEWFAEVSADQALAAKDRVTLANTQR